MEDQQPTAGDLTDPALNTDTTDAGRAPEGGEVDVVQSEPEVLLLDSKSADTADVGESANGVAAERKAEHEAVEDGGVRIRRQAGKPTAIVAAVAAAIFVGAAAFAGATVQPYLADRAAVATKLRVARTAANAITTLWTYTPENMDSLADRAAMYLTGDFGAQYRKFVDAIAAPNKQAKVTNSTVVTGAAVESLNDPDAVAIVYTNTTSTSPLTKNIPALKYLSYRLIMKRVGTRWLVTRMTTVTSLDLTPQM